MNRKQKIINIEVLKKKAVINTLLFSMLVFFFFILSCENPFVSDILPKGGNSKVKAYIPPVIVDFEADSIGKEYPSTGGNGSATVAVVADPINEGQKSLRIAITDYNRAAIIPINLPYELQNYETFSFRINIQGGTDITNKSVMVYAAGSTTEFLAHGFGNPSDSQYAQFAANLAGQTDSVDFSSNAYTNTWTNFIITLNPGAKISNLKGDLYIAIGINCKNAQYLIDDLTFTINPAFEPPPPLPKPQPPSTGAVVSGKYRNLFKEWGKTDAEINAKVQDTWNKLFTGSETNRIYYTVGSDMAYILDSGNNDVRSEGMSYGMMMAVQRDEKDVFDRLWKWAKTYMYNPTKDSKNQRGYFAWQCGTDGSKKDASAAPDGEFYFVTSLLFASARWGDGEGIFEYRKHAMQLLYDMLHRFPPVGQDPGLDTYEVKSMFNLTNHMPVFVPYGDSADHTDPSYHLPAFYEVWAIEMEADANKSKTWGIWSSVQELRDDAAFYRKAVQASRSFFPKATNATTGLGPDYADFNGTARGGDHADFRFDAWRIAMNIAMDYSWWAEDSWQKTFADRIQSFFQSKGVNSYGNKWTLSGTEILGSNGESDHSPGLVACNAVASLAATHERAWEFLEDLWNISMTTEKYRYYDGCLYMMGLLHVTGNFKAYLSGNTTPTSSSSINPTSATFDKRTGQQANIPVTMTLNGNTLSNIQNGGTNLTRNTHYTVSSSTVTLNSSYLATLPIGTTTLTFYFSAGSNRTLTITVTDTTPSASISPATAIFDKRSDLQEDIPVTMTLNGYTFTRVQNGATNLTNGTDYTVSGNTVTLKSSYLAERPNGVTTLTFVFSGGSNQNIAITIRETAPGATPGSVGTKYDFSTDTVTATFTPANTGSTATVKPTTNGGVLEVDIKGQNDLVIIPFDLGSTNLSNYTKIKIEIASIDGDTNYKDIRIFVPNSSGVFVGMTDTATKIIADTRVLTTANSWNTYTISLNSNATASYTGVVNLAFGFPNINNSGLIYQIRNIELIP